MMNNKRQPFTEYLSEYFFDWIVSEHHINYPWFENKRNATLRLGHYIVRLWFNIVCCISKPRNLNVSIHIMKWWQMIVSIIQSLHLLMHINIYILYFFHKTFIYCLLLYIFYWMLLLHNVTFNPIITYYNHTLI